MSATNNTEAFTNCLFQAHKLPFERFKMRGDGRKWKHLASARRVLFNELASFANADGTRIYPAINTIADRLGWSRRKVCYALADLEKLGCVENVGKTGQRGTMMRSLTPPAERVRKPRKPKEPKPEVAEVPASPEVEPEEKSSECKIHPHSAGFASESAGLESRSAGLNPHSAIAVAHNLPSSDLPIKPALPTMPPNRLVGRLGKDFARAKGTPLNKQGKEAVLILAAKKGDDRVILVWGAWIKTRNLDGLTCPFFKFVEEFEETEAVIEKQAADIQEENDRREGRTKATRTVEDSELARKKWRDGLEAAEDIDGYIRDNPAPTLYGDSQGKAIKLGDYWTELIQDARKSLLRRNEPRVIDAVF
jgi:hypothetical protein